MTTPDSRTAAAPKITYSNDVGVIEMILPLPEEGGRSMDEWESLIMTAPDLLAALDNALHVLDNMRIAGRERPSFINIDGVRILAAAAIAKARGIGQNVDVRR